LHRREKKTKAKTHKRVTKRGKPQSITQVPHQKKHTGLSYLRKNSFDEFGNPLHLQHNHIAKRRRPLAKWIINTIHNWERTKEDSEGE
jgi:hypothetical protein